MLVVDDIPFMQRHIPSSRFARDVLAHVLVAKAIRYEILVRILDFFSSLLTLVIHFHRGSQVRRANWNLQEKCKMEATSLVSSFIS